MRFGLACAFLVAVVLPGSSISAAVAPLGVETVRVAYVIPSNRTPQPDAVAHLQDLVRLHHAWTCAEMERNGLAAQSFRYETQADGVTPLVRVVDVSETDDFLRGDIWGRTIAAASAAGLPLWVAGEVWLLVPEIHLEEADGAILGGVALGASFGSGSDPGVAMMGSERLSLATLQGLTDDTLYDGLVVPGIGPHPLVFGTSFPGFEGDAFSGVVSSWEGAALHELSHALGLGHDFRNDSNFAGNLMGNGLRGFRGAIFPNSYPADGTRVSYAAALALDVSRYFLSCSQGTPPFSAPSLPLSTASEEREPAAAAEGAASGADVLGARLLGPSDDATPFPTREPPGSGPVGPLAPGDDTKPFLTILTSGAVTPIGGKIGIFFLADDAGGLSAALLRRGGDTVGEKILSGTMVGTTFETPFFVPGAINDYSISVYDLSGNRADASTTITPAAGFNGAPQPFIRATPARARVGEPILLDASSSSDPDHSQAVLTVEWDFEDDGVFDTSPTTTKTLSISFGTAGSRTIRARLSDPAGAQSLSTVVAVQVVDSSGADLNLDGLVDGVDHFAFLACLAESEPGPPLAGCEDADLDTDADIDCVDWALFELAWTGPGDPTPPPPSCAAEVPVMSRWGLTLLAMLLGTLAAASIRSAHGGKGRKGG